ncbi:MAG: hypothetical protein BGO37_15245 [Cellulomonas sp. 73-92]|uniref:hypothetical protein n=1 Tax=Cellulomonas sp. 73-92 TaxID=1895740 RepID=UPI0009270BA9|nr:hypothetical protein [Cellulomonas sp. 73-92]OJV80884.1 MAG: hypothetical protein BGO37_15245 [Cellulomonas sp. 73-92]
MSWPDPTDPAAAGRARVVTARDDVALARAGVVTAERVPWTGSAADRYRSAVGDEHGRLDRLLAALETLLAELGLPGPWPATKGEVVAGATCWGATGRSVRLGAGTFVSVDPEALADAARRLGLAAGALDRAAADLAVAVWPAAVQVGALGPRSGLVVGLPRSSAGALIGVPGRGIPAGDPREGDPWPGTLGVGGVAERVATLRAGPLAPGPAAMRLRELSGSVRAAARLHGDGETATHRRLRGLAANQGHFPLAGAAEVLPAAVTALWRAELHAGRTLLTSDDPVAALRLDAEEAWSDAMAAGGAEVVVQGLGGLLTAVVPTVLPDPVTVSSGALALLARGGADVVLVPRVDPPRLAPPRGLAGILDVVAATYDEGQPTGLPGTPTATVTVERLDHPDGSRSWLVAVPGTQSWAFDDDVATDMGTNLQLVGGLADPMTAGVLAAMEAAGVAPDEPVVLAGHSQGGMVALAAAAAAAGTYRVGGVVTAGSPSVPGRTPAGVPVVRIEHDEDVVPQADGEPTVAGGDVTRVTRSLADDHPVLVSQAHAVTGYVETARLVDAQVAAAPGSAPGVSAVTGLLGGEGTTATTFQYRVKRAGR